jgi:hypothetical protein
MTLRPSFWKRGRSTLAVLLLTLLSGACDRRPSREGPADGSAGRDDPGALVAGMERTARCEDPIEGYVVEYPADWHVAPGEVLGPCRLFDPEPVEIPVGSELPLEIAVQIGFAPGTLAAVAGDAFGRRELVRERVTVDGRAALRIESETTGDGLHDRGIRMVQYFVGRGDTTMVAATYDVGSLPFERRQRILDAMMASFDFRERE